VASIEVAKGYGATEWRDDLRRTLKLAGIGGRDTVFLLADTQIVEEGFLEDVNNILNSGGRRLTPLGLRDWCPVRSNASPAVPPVLVSPSPASTPASPNPGDVPNLMGPDDQEEIAAAMRPLMAAAGVPATDRNSIYAFYLYRLGLQGLVPCQQLQAGAKLVSAPPAVLLVPHHPSTAIPAPKPPQPQQRARLPAPCAGLLTRRRQLPPALAHVPFPRQLHHHRLVQVRTIF
jgi:hypothetical protein